MEANQRKEILKTYKRTQKGDILHFIPVYQEERLAAYLRPLTFDYQDSLPGIISVLSRWRRENPMAGTGTFLVSDERTEHWLKTYVLNNESRIIFLIMDLQGNYIGHIGLAGFDFEKGIADIDAVLRGEKDVHPGIMGAALQAIIEWGENTLQLKKIYLEVFDDNLHAIQFYEKHHFCAMKKTALVEVKYEGETKWEIEEDMAPELAKRCYIRMEYRGRKRSEQKEK